MDHVLQIGDKVTFREGGVFDPSVEAEVVGTYEGHEVVDLVVNLGFLTAMQSSGIELLMIYASCLRRVRASSDDVYSADES